MRALRVHGTGEPAAVLRIDEVDAPEPRAGQVRVRVGAAAANLPDVMICRGTYPLRPEGVFVLGLEAAGVVDAVGPGVDDGWIGRRAVGVTDLPHGAFADAAIIPADRAYAVPDDVTDVDAVATLIAFQTAHVGLHRRGALAAGETLLVLGAAGGVGSAALQLGRAAGARVVAVAAGPEKACRCRDLGADAVIDSGDDDLAAAVRAVNGGRGVDVVFDPVGGPTHTAVLGALATDARVLLVGFASGVAPVNAGMVLRGSYSLIGVYVGAYGHDEPGRAYLRGVQDQIFADLGAGRIHAVVDRTVGFEGVVAALEDLADRRVTGKVVVVP